MEANYVKEDIIGGKAQGIDTNAIGTPRASCLKP